MDDDDIGDNTTGGYWAVYGILAGAGLVMALSQLLGGWTKWGRPTFSPTVFLLAFVPTAIAVGWILRLPPAALDALARPRR